MTYKFTTVVKPSKYYVGYDFAEIEKALERYTISAFRPPKLEDTWLDLNLEIRMACSSCLPRFILIRTVSLIDVWE